MIYVYLYILISMILFLLFAYLSLGYFFEEQDNYRGSVCLIPIIFLVVVPCLAWEDSVVEEIKLTAHLTVDGMPYVEHNQNIIMLGRMIERNIIDGDIIIAKRITPINRIVVFDHGSWHYIHEKDYKR